EIEAGGIGGLAGCNQFGGGLELGPGDGFAATELFLTEMACEPITLLDFESVYVGALAAADTWEVTPTGLLLTGNDVELRYDPAPATAPTPLEGTRWIFDTVFSGAGVERAASTPAFDRAEVTLWIEAETAVVAADDCGEVSLALAHEGGADGNVAPGAAPAPPCEADASNLPEALDGIVAATGFMITDNRLTFIGTDGETVGFRAG
ncbi:MAG: META domain-containing protein, partial [Actinomycetota bacterium]